MKAKKCSTQEAHALAASTSHRLAKFLTALIAGLFAANSAWALPSCPVSPKTISKCCIADQAGQSYELSKDLTSGGACIKISAPRVMFSMNGNITSTSSTPKGIGVHILSTAHNAVFFGSGNIEGFKTGFQTDAPNTFSLGISAVSDERGMVFNGPNAFGFFPSATDSAKNGIILTSAASGSFIYEPTSVVNGGNGIVLNRTTDVTLREPFAEQNTGYGLWLKGSSSNGVIDGVLEGNKVAGAYLGCHAGGPSSAPCAIPPSNNNTLTTGVVGSCPAGEQGAQQYGIVIDDGNAKNRVVGVASDTNSSCSPAGDTKYDGYDGNLQPNCRHNIWYVNKLKVENQTNLINILKNPGCME